MPRTHTTNSEPRYLALWDPSLGTWWRSGPVPSWAAVSFGFGRVLVVDPASPRVVHAREKLECPVTLSLPVFTRGAYPYTVRGLIGDELVVWSDTTEVPPCPDGTPCDRWTEQHRGPPSEAGAVLSP